MVNKLNADIFQNGRNGGEIRPFSPFFRPGSDRVIAELSPLSPLSPLPDKNIKNSDFFNDDRRFCKDCKNLNSRDYCTKQRFKPVDDIPRRCVDFD